MILILSKFISQVLNNTLYYYYYYWKIGLFGVLVRDAASTSGYCIYSIYSNFMENKWNTSLNILLISSVSRICNFSVNCHLLMLIETEISLVSHLIQNMFAVANWFYINIISRTQGNAQRRFNILFQNTKRSKFWKELYLRHSYRMLQP